MTDQPEKKSETEDVEADFEGHKIKVAPSDAKTATDDDSADFEGHKMVLGPEKKYKKA
ncbi:MAG: hypothetical protein LH654_12300 [Thermoleophilia bacterium]|nr:hypothetical protein [Thermoleophilia bacterium]